MPIIDSQVHAYEANTPARPWHSVPNWPAHVTGDEMVAAMAKVGVDGAILISRFSMYQYDESYAVEVQKAYPDKFALVKPVNPTIHRCRCHRRQRFVDQAAVPAEIARVRLLSGYSLRQRWQVARPRNSSRPTCCGG